MKVPRLGTARWLAGLALAAGCGDDDDDKTGSPAPGGDTGAATAESKVEPGSQPGDGREAQADARRRRVPLGVVHSRLVWPPTPTGPKVTSVICPSDVEPGTRHRLRLQGDAPRRPQRRRCWMTLKSENLTPSELSGSGATTTLSGTVN